MFECLHRLRISFLNGRVCSFCRVTTWSLSSTQAQHWWFQFVVVGRRRILFRRLCSSPFINSKTKPHVCYLEFVFLSISTGITLIYSKIKGRVKVCSESLIFDPEDHRNSVIKIYYKDVSFIYFFFQLVQDGCYL